MPTKTRGEAPKANGRDSRGRFVAGNPGGPGNPYARRVAELRSALLAAASPADIRALALAMLRAGKDGDVAAAKLVLAYLIGPPRAELEVTGPGGGPVLAVSGEDALARLRAELEREEGAAAAPGDAPAARLH